MTRESVSCPDQRSLCHAPNYPLSVEAEGLEIAAKRRYAGIVAGADVEVVAVDQHGASATVTYRTSQGQLGEVVLTADDLTQVREVTERRWSFDADGAMFRLASEARRMKWAHLADPFAAVDTSNIEPYPHQIDAVYNRFLPLSAAAIPPRRRSRRRQDDHGRAADPRADAARRCRPVPDRCPGKPGRAVAGRTVGQVRAAVRADVARQGRGVLEREPVPRTQSARSPGSTSSPVPTTCGRSWS